MNWKETYCLRYIRFNGFVFCQIKVMTDRDLLAVACEQFLGKSVMEIKGVVLQTLEGHLRSILG